MRAVAEITADLSVAYAARRKAMQATSHSGAGVSVTRDLAELNNTITGLEAEKAAAEAVENGNGTVTFVPTMRGH